ncbi:MAG: sigma-54 dependent transcriptional regulator [Candidatus Hinthialibacter antarcticus]|nr:sigma-54 dependent transcriptional regulator [Candidatus Hinthialibacter antarcticus]
MVTDPLLGKSTILIVDDEEDVHYSFGRFLSPLQCTLLKATSGEEALEVLKYETPDLIIMDIKMGGMDGLSTLKEVNKLHHQSPVIMMTAFSTTTAAIEATRLGAFDYVLKPFDPPKMMEVIQSALSTRRMMQKSVVWGANEGMAVDDDVLIGNASAMQEVYKLIGKVADSDALVLITGESGTGKELVARAIYSHSQRKNQIFLPVNCAAIPETLLESELFGHEKGSFSGAHERRIGKFEQARNGTIFLDEIGELSMVTQGKLLRVLQDQNFQRVGGKEFIQSNARVIAATNCSLAAMVKDNKFREDLYYRLQVVTIQLPALSERRSDIPLLARYFAKRAGFETLPLSKEAEEFLMNHEWPGNVRELENSIQRALLLSRGSVITIDHLHAQGGARDKSGENGPASHEVREGLDYALDQLWSQIISQQQSRSIKVYQWLETELAKRAMTETSGNQVKSAKLLGISRNTLRQRLGL